MTLELLARRAPGLTMTGLALAGAAVTLLPGVASAQISDGLRGARYRAEQPSTARPSRPIPPTLGAASIYVVDPAQSEARYIAEEELANVGANTAVGTTNTIQGAFLFDADGNPIACSTIYVDVRTFVSDSSRRDNYLRGNTLQSDQYPLAEFVVTEIQGFTMPADGEETTFTLVGNFTLHGVTQAMAWEVTASRDGDTMTGIGQDRIRHGRLRHREAHRWLGPLDRGRHPVGDRSRRCQFGRLRSHAPLLASWMRTRAAHVAAGVDDEEEQPFMDDRRFGDRDPDSIDRDWRFWRIWVEPVGQASMANPANAHSDHSRGNAEFWHHWRHSGSDDVF